MPYENILFPVDLSEASPQLVGHLLVMAEKFSSRIHLLYVMPSFEQHTLGLYDPDPEIKARLRARAEELLARFAQEHLGAYPEVERVVRSGDPAEGIVDYIKKSGIDLVIMGTHGRKGLDRVLVGSVAQRVVQNSPVPVLTIHPHRKR